MKRTATTLLIVVTCFYAGRFFHELPVSAQDAKDKFPPCQDVNGDGEFNITDPVFLLDHLFLGGPEPSCPASPPTSRSLPTTGQTTCYDALGNTIECNNSDFPGQDGFYQEGCPPDERFVDIEDGTVEDVCTGLVWQQTTAPGTYNWQQALHYCEDLILCKDGTWTTDPAEAELHGGVMYDDWRLPNWNELLSLVLVEEPMSIAPVFESVPEEVYWTSTTWCGKPAGRCKNAAVYRFNDMLGSNLGAGPWAFDKGTAVRVRAVRSSLGR